jgi:hypothetical protein
MNRRGFLASFLAIPAAALVLEAPFTKDPERALWVPGRKLISIPGKREQFGMTEADWEDVDRWYLLPALRQMMRFSGVRLR